MATTTAIAARCRNPKMSAISYRLSTTLFHSGTKYGDLVRLSRFGICMHPRSIVSFEEKLSEKYDAKVQFWKKILKRTSRQYFYYKRCCKTRFVLHGQVTINIILCLKWKVHQKINYMHAMLKKFSCSLETLCTTTLRNPSMYCLVYVAGLYIS